MAQRDQAEPRRLPPWDHVTAKRKPDERAEDGKCTLHHRCARVAGAEFAERELLAACHPRRMLDKIDVYGGTEECARASGGDSEQKHVASSVGRVPIEIGRASCRERV